MTVTFTQRAPIGGWNTRDDIGNMPSEDAELLENWIPDVSSLRLRSGSVNEFTVSTAEAIQHLFESRNASFARQLIFTGTTISASYTGGVTQLATGLQSGFWQCENFSGRTFMVNGVDSPKVYLDSTISYSNAPQASDLTNAALTGLDVTKLSDVHAYRGRLLFAERGSADFWYLDVDAVQGALTRFPLSRVARKGGSLLKIASWTVDGGDGPDDYAVFIMSTGEVVVYQGNDPGRSSAWGLVGRYTIDEPINARCIAKFGGNIIIATTSDLVTIPARFSQPEAMPTKLSGAIREAAAKYRNLAGWQLLWYPSGPWMILNVPTGVASSEQYILNIKSAAATKFTGWNTLGFGVFNEQLYYGSATEQYVFRANEGYTDQTSLNTTATITGRCWTAPTNCGVAHPKHIDDYRKMLTSEGTVRISSGLVYDFSGKPDFTQLQVIEGGGTQWGAPWGSPWNEGDFSRNEWIGGAGDGEYVQLRSEVTASRQTPRWFKTQYRYRPVGPLE